MRVVAVTLTLTLTLTLTHFFSISGVMATLGATKASDGPRKEPNAMPTMRLEHQESINRFSRLNTEKKMLEARKKALERALEDAEEAGNEVMLADEETGAWPWDWISMSRGRRPRWAVASTALSGLSRIV